MDTQRKTVFMVGNKRSGTSVLVQLLNLHPRVFVSHESDIAWILYQSRNGRPWRYSCYPWDGPVGMQATLKAARKELRALPRFRAPTAAELAEAFFSVQRRLMEKGSAVQQPYPRKQGVLWIGDKKPVQQAQPEINGFIEGLFERPIYIHLVRHPEAVLNSARRAAQQWDVVPDYWKADRATLLERWRIHEEWVQQARRSHGERVVTLRYEDLLADPVRELRPCFDALGLEMDVALNEAIRALVKAPDHPARHVLAPEDMTDPLAAMMDRYGYLSDGRT